MRRRDGSAYKSLLGSGSGTRNRPIAPGESGPCCHDNPMDHLTIVSGSPCGGEALLEGNFPTSSLPTPGSSGCSRMFVRLQLTHHTPDIPPKPPPPNPPLTLPS